MPSPFALHDIAAVRELERHACARAGIAEDTLMRRAGLAGWQALLAHWPAAMRVLVLAGPGNNGGDGWVLARHALESGRHVRVVTPADMPPRSELARQMAAEYREAGGIDLPSEGELPEADIIVDALFGLGLDRAPEGAAAGMIAAANAMPVPRLALDVPSGVDAARGAVPGIAVLATRTLQFLAAHAGLATGAALDHVGLKSLAALDLPAACFEGIAPAAELQARPRWPSRPRDSHKGRNGHLLLAGGAAGSGGAIIIAAEAALRAGAGLATVATDATHLTPLLARRPEAMAHAVDGGESLYPLLERADALVVGPGLGTGDWGRSLLDAVLDAGRPCVLDADALNLLVQRSGSVSHAQAVLTPHPGEAARLLGCPVAEIQADRFGAARRLCERFRCAVVLKGAGTIVVAPGERPRVLDVGNPGMASGGMGDALAGVIGARLAAGNPPFVAAAEGAWLHSRAGDLAAGDGEVGMLASDLVDRLRPAILECLDA